MSKTISKKVLPCILLMSAFVKMIKFSGYMLVRVKFTMPVWEIIA